LEDSNPVKDQIYSPDHAEFSIVGVFYYLRVMLGESQRTSAMPMQINPTMNDIVDERFSLGKRL
jgi:hypothetical protein